MDPYDPLLEMCFRCSDLRFLSGHHEPNTMISVQYTQPAHGFWQPHASTNVQQSSFEPAFLCTVAFYPSHAITANTKLRFLVYRVRKQDSIEEIGSCFCVVHDLILHNGELRMDLQLNTDFAGCLHILALRHSLEPSVKLKSKSALNLSPAHATTQQSGAVNQPRAASDSGLPPKIRSREVAFNRSLRAMYGDVISRTYRFQTASREEYINVQELMFETSYSFHVPVCYLRLCIAEVTKRISMLEQLCELRGKWETERCAELERCKTLSDTFHKKLHHLLRCHKKPCIKKSADKASVELEFVPINLHLQRLRVRLDMTSSTSSTTSRYPACDSSSIDRRVTSSDDVIAEYDIVTVGATAMHSMGFKQGGLLALIVDQGGKSKRQQLHPLAHCAQTSSSPHEHVMRKVDMVRSQIKYQTRKLKTIIRSSSNNVFTSSAGKSHPASASDPVTSAAHDTLILISKKTCEMATCFDTAEFGQAISSLNAATAHSNCESTGANTTPGRTNVSWEDVKLRVRSSLSAVVKSTDPFTGAPRSTVRHSNGIEELSDFIEEESPGEDLRVVQAMSDLSRLEEDIDMLFRQAELAMFLHHLTADIAGSNHTNRATETEYRRHAVFSQALSACVCGVANAIMSAAAGSRPQRLRQFARVGIFVQFESLLSTYGNELGMLQDYAVGVVDLNRVSVKCERQAHNSDHSPQHGDVSLLPTVHGSTDAPNVVLHLDDATFENLPRELQNGKFIKIHPVIYSVGINEEQTLAEKFGDTSLQDYLNREALQRTLAYYELVRDKIPEAITSDNARNNSPASNPSPASGAGSSSPPDHEPIFQVLDQLRIAVQSRKHKHVETLHRAAEACRGMNGVRVTSCKSAKDRTAMSVTLEQASILRDHHHISDKTFTQALSVMRSNGTRLENTLKNVGSRKFAFTSIQLMTFPKQYRPPDGTFGKLET